MSVYLNQRLELTLTMNDPDGQPIDLTAETGNVSLLILSPDGTETTKTPTIGTPATEGKISHIFAVDDLDTLGPWKTKGYLGTQQIPSTFYTIDVKGRWET